MAKTPKPTIHLRYGHGLVAEPDFAKPFFGGELLRYGGIDHLRRIEQRLIGRDELRTVLSVTEYPQLPDWLLALTPTTERDTWIRVSILGLSDVGAQMLDGLNFGGGIFRNVPNKKDSLCLISLLKEELAGLGTRVDGLAHPHKLLGIKKDDLASYGAEMNRTIRTDMGLPIVTAEGKHSTPEGDHGHGRRK